MVYLLSPRTPGGSRKWHPLDDDDSSAPPQPNFLGATTQEVRKPKFAERPEDVFEPSPPPFDPSKFAKTSEDKKSSESSSGMFSGVSCAQASSAWDVLSFAWLKPLLDKGNKNDRLDSSDFPQLRPPDVSSTVYDQFKKAYAAEKVETKRRWQWSNAQGAGKPGYKASKEPPAVSLRNVLWAAFSGPFVRAGFLKLIHDLCVFVGPAVLKALVKFLQTPHAPTGTGIGLTIAVTLSQLTMSLCLRQYFYECYRSGLRLRTSVVLAVYDKSLVLAASERLARSTGEITNLMSVDAQRLQDLTPYLHAVWYSFLQIALAIFFLWQELGPSCIGGVMVIFVMMPVTKRVAKRLGALQKVLMKAKDERTKVNNEVLSGMKVIKLQAWEKSFYDKVLSLRKIELDTLKQYMILQSVSGTLWSTVPLLVAVATFTAYIASGHELDVGTALTSLALFEILRFPLFMLPNVINNLVEAKLSVERVQRFLACKEHKPVEGAAFDGVNVENATFVWEGKKTVKVEGDDADFGDWRPTLSASDKVKSCMGLGDNKVPTKASLKEREAGEDEWEVILLKKQLADAEAKIKELTASQPIDGSKVVSFLTPAKTPISQAPQPQAAPAPAPASTKGPAGASMMALKRIDFACHPGELVAVVGAVGSGKSTLLNGLLGECRALFGTVQSKGRVAYAAQKPFIMNDSVKNNVTFSKPMDQKRYEKTLAACALKQDLDILPGGDNCEIGEKGINLSGGQKARVSLARAVYQDADIYLLDDPLSAVDAHVGRHIFDECIVNMLLKNDSKSPKAQASVVLVTNALNFLNDPRVSRIVVLENGMLKEVGSYRELASDRSSLFHKLLQVYRESTGDRTLEDGDEDDFLVVQKQGGASSAASNLKVVAASGRRCNAGQQLMTDEMKERETGSVDNKVYARWADAAGGRPVAVYIVVAYAAVEGLGILAKYWLAYWSNKGGEPGERTQGGFLGIYFLINMSIVAAMFVNQLVLYFASLKASEQLYTDLLESILCAPMSFFDTTPIGRILNRFSKDMYTVDEQLVSTLRSYLSTLSTVVGVLIVVSSVTPLFILFLIPIMWFYVNNQRYFTKSYRELKRLDSVARSPIYALFGETLDGVATIRAYGCQAILKQKMEDYVNNSQTAYFLTFTAQCWLAVRLELAGTMIIAFACLCAVIESTRYHADRDAFAGVAGLSISFALSVTQSLNWSVRMASDLEAQMVAVERIGQYVDGIRPEAASDKKIDRKLPASFPQGKIVFQDVKMRYRPDLPLVLDGCSFTIPAGSKVGVVGRTGAGKSSLMAALLRLVELRSGSITIDGVNHKDLGLNKLRNSIAVIPQDPVLFGGTIRTNLDPFNENGDNTLKALLARVGLMDSESGLLSGTNNTARISSLQDKVEEEGCNFSVGQRQLLVIARALLTKSNIIVMDEATAAIDVDTDARIQKAMKEDFKDATVITIAHRLNSILGCDYILVMDNGKSVEFDTPQNLRRIPSGIFVELERAYEQSNKE